MSFLSEFQGSTGDLIILLSTSTFPVFTWASCAMPRHASAMDLGQADLGAKLLEISSLLSLRNICLGGLPITKSRAHGGHINVGTFSCPPNFRPGLGLHISVYSVSDTLITPLSR
ncbi:hypothetical protein DFS33DRAFT_1355391 [Desarmillaria ectypa]|nr:hypothetical protein DFS33DRAFT_1355391 [Desarmillaria ectypa]